MGGLGQADSFEIGDAIFQTEGSECSEKLVNFLSCTLKTQITKVNRSSSNQGCHSTATLVQIFTDDGTEPSIQLWWKVARSKSGSGFELLRDVKSYANEAEFYISYATKLQGLGLSVPSCLRVAVSGASKHFDACSSDELKQVCYALALKDMTGFCPHPNPFLDEERILAGLAWLARLHGAFWGKAHGLPGLWQTGSWWSKDKQCLGQGVIESAWQRHLAALGQRLHGLEHLGRQLEESHELVADELAKSKTPRSLLHGDVKVSNMLFATGEVDKKHEGIALIDWQWAGAGLAVCDVADFIASSWEKPADLLVDGGALEQRWLYFYCLQLAHQGVHYPHRQAVKEFRMASLELGCMYCVWLWNFVASDNPESANVQRMISHARYLDGCLKHLQPPPTPKRNPTMRGGPRRSRPRSPNNSSGRWSPAKPSAGKRRQNLTQLERQVQMRISGVNCVKLPCFAKAVKAGA